jgi:hypothetical protein
LRQALDPEGRMQIWIERVPEHRTTVGGNISQIGRQYLASEVKYVRQKHVSCLRIAVHRLSWEGHMREVKRSSGPLVHFAFLEAAWTGQALASTAGGFEFIAGDVRALLAAHGERRATNQSMSGIGFLAR